MTCDSAPSPSVLTVDPGGSVARGPPEVVDATADRASADVGVAAEVAIVPDWLTDADGVPGDPASAYCVWGSWPPDCEFKKAPPGPVSNTLAAAVVAGDASRWVAASGYELSINPLRKLDNAFVAERACTAAADASAPYDAGGTGASDGDAS